MEEKLYEHVLRRDGMNAFMHHNFNERVEVDRDYGVCRLVIRPESLNPFGMVHGGALCTLADNAAGIAAHTDGRRYVTQTGTLHFLKNQGEGVIRAQARVRHRGRSTALVEVDVTGDGGKLLATGEYTFFCIDPAGDPRG